jgi:hypothetical protein
MKKIVLITGIFLVAGIATKDTIEIFKELDKISVQTPAQWGMRQPAQQNPGQMQIDIQTRQNRNKNYNKIWDNNNSYDRNSLDNYNKNPNKTQQNQINKFINR